MAYPPWLLNAPMAPVTTPQVPELLTVRRVIPAGALAALAALCVLLIPLSPAAGFKIRGVKLDGQSYLYVRDVSSYYGLTGRFGETEARLSSKKATVVLTIDKREARINGVEVHLSMAPRTLQDQWLISELDFRLLFEPILRDRSLPKAVPQCIVIDPGHGGTDRGTAGRTRTEKTVVLEVATRLARLLRQAGYRVYLTRTGDDKSMELDNRLDVARSVRADLFLSLHANYVGNSTVSGIECYLLSPAGTSGTYSNKTTSSRSDGNRFDAANARLAFEIQRALVQETGADDRGIRHAGFFVLRRAPCTAVLIEMGFMSHREEEKRISTPEYQEKLARGISAGVAAYRRAVATRQ